MRFFGLAFAVVLLSSSIVFAQHSSGGGSSGGSSSSGGGGSHSSFSGASSSAVASGGSHSAGSTAHVSSTHGTNAPVSSHLKASGSSATAGQSSTRTAQARTAPAERRSFFSFLRHPFHRTQPKAAADLRRPVCFRGPCPVCPAGQVNARGVCGVAFNFRRNDYCSNREIWSGGACLEQIQFLNDCNALRTAMQQEEQRRRTAQLAQQVACSMGSAQDCSESMTASRSEENLYRALQTRYRRCQQQFVTTGPFATYDFADRQPLFGLLTLDAGY